MKKLQISTIRHILTRNAVLLSDNFLPVPRQGILSRTVRQLLPKHNANYKLTRTGVILAQGTEQLYHEPMETEALCVSYALGFGFFTDINEKHAHLSHRKIILHFQPPFEQQFDPLRFADRNSYGLLHQFC